MPGRKASPKKVYKLTIAVHDRQYQNIRKFMDEKGISTWSQFLRKGYAALTFLDKHMEDNNLTIKTRSGEEHSYLFNLFD